MALSDRGVVDDSHRYEITYRTPDTHGRLTSVDAVVQIPTGAPPAGGWPVIAWDHGTSGLGRQCGPSQNAQSPDLTTLVRLARAGYVAVGTDYVGLSASSSSPHPYLNTRTEATATIDAVRAAHHLALPLSPRWMSFGVSQGGQASLGTGQAADRYAPRLDYRGTVALAPLTGGDAALSVLGPHIADTPTSMQVYVEAALASMAVTQRRVNITAHLTPRGRTVFAQLRDACVSDWTAATGGASARDIFAKPFTDNGFDAAVADYFGVPTAGYRHPVFIGHGTRDTTVPIVASVGFAAHTRAAGTRLDFRTYPTDHGGILDAGWRDALAFIDAQMRSGGRAG